MTAPEISTAERRGQLEVELAALRENSALAHRELHDAMYADIEELTRANERLHLTNARLRTSCDLAAERNKKLNATIARLQAGLAAAQQERDAARAELRGLTRNRLVRLLAARRCRG
jgi:ABC-type phosphate transport system auxiliary subunit